MGHATPSGTGTPSPGANDDVQRERHAGQSIGARGEWDRKLHGVGAAEVDLIAVLQADSLT